MFFYGFKVQSLGDDFPYASLLQKNIPADGKVLDRSMQFSGHMRALVAIEKGAVVFSDPAMSKNHAVPQENVVCFWLNLEQVAVPKQAGPASAAEADSAQRVLRQIHKMFAPAAGAAHAAETPPTASAHQLCPFKPGMLVKYSKLPPGCRFDETAKVHKLVLENPGVADVMEVRRNETGHLMVLADLFRSALVDTF